MSSKCVMYCMHIACLGFGRVLCLVSFMQLGSLKICSNLVCARGVLGWKNVMHCIALSQCESVVFLREPEKQTIDNLIVHQKNPKKLKKLHQNTKSRSVDTKTKSRKSKGIKMSTFWPFTLWLFEFHRTHFVLQGISRANYSMHLLHVISTCQVKSESAKQIMQSLILFILASDQFLDFEAWSVPFGRRDVPWSFRMFASPCLRVHAQVALKQLKNPWGCHHPFLPRLQRSL